MFSDKWQIQVSMVEIPLMSFIWSLLVVNQSRLECSGARGAN